MASKRQKDAFLNPMQGDGCAQPTRNFSRPLQHLFSMTSQFSMRSLLLSWKRMRIPAGVDSYQFSAGVAEDRQMLLYARHIRKKKLPSWLILAILLASTVGWQLIPLLEWRLQQACDGILGVGALTQNHHLLTSRLQKKRRQTEGREEAQTPPSSAKASKLASRQVDGAVTSVLESASAAAQTTKARPPASTDENKVWISETDSQVLDSSYAWTGRSEELTYWEHLGGEAPPALAFLLRKSVAQAICPFPHVASNHGPASACTARPPPIVVRRSPLAEASPFQAAAHACTSGICTALQRARRPSTSSSNTSGEIVYQAGYEERFSQSTSTREGSGARAGGVQKHNHTFATKQQYRLTGHDDVQQPEVSYTADVKINAYPLRNHMQDSVQELSTRVTMPVSATSATVLQHHPSVNSFDRWPKMVHEERINGASVDSHEAVVFEAPHFTAKIVRYANESHPRANLDKPSVVDSVTGSLIQEYLDRECATASGPSGHTRAYMRHYRDGFFCFAASELDFTKQTLSCVDSCGAPIKCRGKVDLPPSESTANRRLHLKPSSAKLKGLYCVNSRLQARLNELCGSADLVWRTVAGGEVCIPAKDVNWQQSDAVCRDDCGQPTPCYGVPRYHAIIPDEERARLSKKKDAEIRKFCTCDEKMEPGVVYKGCQTVTRSGRTCQFWNSKKPHEHVELTGENHNFCRNPYKESAIWCYTTDPQVRYDYCDPLGVQNQYIQPEEVLDVVLTGRDLNPYVALRMFTGPPNKTARCGLNTKDKLRSTYFTFLNSTPESENIPQATMKDGVISQLTWKGLSIADEAAGRVTLCGCSYWFVVSTPPYDVPCSSDKDYTVELGTLQVAGPRFPGDSEVRLSTDVEAEIVFQGVDLSVGDILTIRAGTDLKDCMKSNQFSAQVAASGGNSHTAIDVDNAVQLRTVVEEVLGPGTGAKSAPLRLPTTGRYLLCWSGVLQKFAARAAAENVTVTGFNTNRRFLLVGSPLRGYSSLQQSTIYFSTYQITTKIDSGAITIRTASTPPCSGTEIGRSNRIKLMRSIVPTTEEKLYKANCVLAETAFQNTGVGESVLDVCAKTDGAVIQLGIGTLGNTFLYNFSDFVTPPELHPEAPDGVFTYQIDQYSPLGLHWWSVTDDAENIMTAADPMFRTGTFPKALSLWVNRVQGYITAWVFEPADPAPDLLLIWKVSRAVTVALDVCHKHAHLYVATSKPAQLHMFDVKNPAVTTLEHPLATVDGKAEGFKDIRSIVPIYTTSTDDCKPLILVLDRDSGFLLLYNTDLTLIKKTNQLDGMTSPMSHPSSLSCTPRTPTGSSNFLETWDCVIVDSETSLVIYFRVNPLTQTILFLGDYRKGSLKESRNTGIQSPNGVLAHRFANKTLIYVAEEESPDMHLLLVEEEETLIRFEDFVRPADTGPAIRHIFIIPIKLYPDNPEDVLLATLREGLSGPSLLFTLLSNTGQVPEFFYQPREWYGVGDTHTLEPLPRGSGTLDRIREYTFDATSKDSAYVSSIATIDRETGVIHLSITHVYTQDVLIIVIGNGLVNKQVSEFTIRVACRDGYYVNNGTCVKCEAGTYNSMLLVAEKPHTAWAACHSCPSGYSTVTEGAVSANQCQCQKGYHLDEQGTNCVPCPAGTWKNNVANQGCQGKCPAHSNSEVEGATTPEERQCNCEPGYYDIGQTEGCLQVPKGFFSPGGYKAELIPCPAGTTNEVDQSGEAKTALSSCLCDKGYTPASLEALEDPSSTASLLKAYLTSSLHYAELLDSQVCIKCEKGYYKDAVGNQKCEPCPKNSYTPTLGATSLENCSQCAPGYFPFGDAGKPCRKCPKDHFCVGSEPTISTLIRYANKMVPCPPFSKTLLFAVNDHPFKCMCRTGYELQSVGIGLDVVCVRTRLNHYKDIVSNMPGTPCPSNTVTATTKSTSTFDCICLPGQFLNKATNECEPCPTGFYCVGKRDPNDFTDAQPIKCPPLTSTYDIGASEFKQCLCDKGYQRKKVQSGIQKDVQCSPCPVNTYKDWVGDAVCRACGENSGTRNEGATSAAQCLCFKGYYYSYTISQCTACSGDSRKYCPGGEEACDADDPRCVDGKKPAEPQPCPKHTRIPAGYDAASSVDDCKCEPGFGFKSGESSEEASTCVPCPPGTYKPSVQNSACNSLCGASATSFPGARSQSQCFCEEGTFRVGETCHSCPAGAICAGGLLVEAQVKLQRDPHFTRITSAHHVKPYAKAGFFLSKLREELRTLNDWRFTPCPIEKACLEWGRCVETMTEYLCSECRPNFTSNFAKGELCTACPSMGWNIALLTLYYLGTLLFNIMMTYMNVAAGFNRKSIHSIVIKIASNFLTCMSIVGILDLKTIELPEWVAKLTRRVTERVTVTQRVQWLSVDCLLRQGFRLSYPESFFYTMLFYALLPIALPIVATAIMYVVLWRTQAWYRASTQRKLNMIKQAEQCGLEALSDQLRERCAQDRVFLIFRYIPIPGESRLTRFTKFMEDMIPIYVTVLFFLHSPTTTQMLSLLDCTYTDFGRGHKPKYFLRAAMSVECQIGLGKPYFKYLALGMVGLCTWSIGIPLSGFVVLYMKRKDLYSRATRLKYGFLHNGFLKKYWYWETVAFARKLLVLMSTSVGLIHSKNTVSSRVWLAMVIAIVFLLFHSLAQPFDKRSYLTLDRLETHSMGIWTITCVIMAMVLGSDLGGNTNMALLCFVVLLVFLFLLDVAFSLVIAYFDNVRAQKTFFTVPLIGHVFKFFGRLSEKRRAHEPVVIYDAENENFQLVAAKRRGWHFFGKKTEKIHLAERDYFIKVMTETMWFAVAHMKLNVIPGAFLEFILLLGMTIHKMDENSQENNKSLQAIADGDLSRLAEWSRNERVKKEGAKVVAQRKRDIKRRMRNFYNRLGKGLHRRKGAGFLKLDCAAADGDGHKISDYEDSDATEGTASTSSEQDARDDDQVDEVETASSTLPSLTEGSVADWDSDMLLLIDKQQITTGIVLSELYLALLKLQQKDSSGIGNQYEAFRNQRLAALEAHTEQLLEKNNKLKLIRLAFQSLLTNSPEELRRLGIDEASFSRTTQELSDLNQKICELNSILQDLETNPEKVDTCPEEEWVDKEVFDDFLAHRSAESQGVEQPAESSSEEGLFQHSETANQNEGNEF